jgi:hypothetical protein
MNIPTVLSEVGIGRSLHVMLFRPDDLRDERPRKRDGKSTSFAIFENWTGTLRTEAIAAGDFVTDTWRNSTDHVCEQILHRHEEPMHTGAQLPTRQEKINNASLEWVQG